MSSNRLSDKNKQITFVPSPQSPDVAGFIKETADDVVPEGWLECNGQTVPEADYPELFAKIGTTYNTGGEPVGEFRLPGGSQLNNAVVTGTLDVSDNVAVDTDAFVVDATNSRIGINEDSPQSPVHVTSGGPDLLIRVENSVGNIIGGHAESATNDGVYTVRDSTGSTRVNLSGDTSQANYLLNSTGIGKTSPSYRLDVNQNASDVYVARFEQDNTTGFGVLIDGASTDASDPLLKVDNGGGTVFEVTGDGNAQASNSFSILNNLIGARTAFHSSFFAGVTTVSFTGLPFAPVSQHVHRTAWVFMGGARADIGTPTVDLFAINLRAVNSGNYTATLTTIAGSPSIAVTASTTSTCTVQITPTQSSASGDYAVLLVGGSSGRISGFTP